MNDTLVIQGLQSLERQLVDLRTHLFATNVGMLKVNDTIEVMKSEELRSRKDRDEMSRNLSATRDELSTLEVKLELLRSDLDRLREDTRENQRQTVNNTATISARLQVSTVYVLCSYGLSNSVFPQQLSANVSANDSVFLESLNQLREAYESDIMHLAGKAEVAEKGLTGLMEHSMKLQGNFSNLMVFAAARKAEVLTCSFVVTTGTYIYVKYPHP